MRVEIPLKLGSACAILGALGIFIGNFLHPFPPADREGMLQLIAGEPAWAAIHLPTMFFAVAILIALVSLADSMERPGAASLARVGRTVAHVGVPVMLVGAAIDGYGFKALADAWASAPVAERAMIVAAADALILAETGILHIWVTFFLGVTFILYGAAVASSATYPRLIGWLGVLGGAGCLLSGVAGFLRLPLTVPFPVFGTVVLAWMFAMGVLMARRTAVAST